MMPFPKGGHHSEETKLKMSQSHMGQKHTADFIALVKDRKGSKNPHWKGNSAKPKTGRYRAEVLFDCPKGKERHHINGNPLNNDSSNIQLVTRREHMVLDGRYAKIPKQLEKGRINSIIRRRCKT